MAFFSRMAIMTWYDWLILVLPVSFVMFMGFYVRRYVRGVSDFLSAGRLCGRYVICVGDVANALSIIGLVSYIEMHYKTGFSVGLWSSVLTPLSLLLGLLGFATYRFRETRAMSLGQFLEMRYSRRFRVAAAGLRVRVHLHVEDHQMVQGGRRLRVALGREDEAGDGLELQVVVVVEEVPPVALLPVGLLRQRLGRERTVRLLLDDGLLLEDVVQPVHHEGVLRLARAAARPPRRSTHPARRRRCRRP